jgi:hypothetical protein
MAESKELKWACGCYEIDGVLAAQCTQIHTAVEVGAHHRFGPYAEECFRIKEQEETPTPTTAAEDKAAAKQAKKDELAEQRRDEREDLLAEQRKEDREESKRKN